jgi:hypothetical protein
MTAAEVENEVMSAIEMQTHLQQLEAERAQAMMEGLGHSAAYMADLTEEIEVTRHAYVATAVTEIAVLRAELSGTLEG